MRSGYKKTKAIGPGGVKCACCTIKVGGNKNAKSILNRIYRRAGVRYIKDLLKQIHSDMDVVLAVA